MDLSYHFPFAWTSHLQKAVGHPLPSYQNSVHWVLDVTFHEDLSRVRAGYADHNFAILRRIALNLLRHEKTAKSSIHTKRLKAGWNTDYLEKVLLG